MFLHNICPNSPEKKDDLKYIKDLWTQSTNTDGQEIHGINFTWEIILLFVWVYNLSECPIQVKDNTNRLLVLSQGRPQLLNGGDHLAL